MGVQNKIKHDRIYKNHEYSDIAFIVNNRNGGSVKIPAHRLLLMTQSPVFERMLYGDMKEGSSVTITDVSAEAFEKFLQFFYLPEVELTRENIAEILKLVDKYDTSAFWSACEAFMEQTLDVASVFQYYELVLSFNLSAKIRGPTEELICKNPKGVFERSAEGGMSLDRLTSILKWDKFSCEEIDVFKGVMAWAKASLKEQNESISVENIKKLLGDSVKVIRFPVMAMNNLLECFNEYPSLLPPEQMIDILKYVETKEPLAIANEFICKKRFGAEYTISFNTISFIKKCNPDASSSCLRMTTTLNKPMKYSVTLKIHKNIAWLPSNISVRVWQNDAAVQDENLPLLTCDMECYRLIKLRNPISFNEANDEVMLTLSLSASNYCYYSNNYACSVLPDGLKIEPKLGVSPFSFVSEICLKETF